MRAPNPDDSRKKGVLLKHHERQCVRTYYVDATLLSFKPLSPHLRCPSRIYNHPTIPTPPPSPPPPANRHTTDHESSASSSIMLGTPPVMGKRRPVSGQTSAPSITCTSNSVLCSARRNSSSWAAAAAVDCVCGRGVGCWGLVDWFVGEVESCEVKWRAQAVYGRYTSTTGRPSVTQQHTSKRQHKIPHYTHHPAKTPTPHNPLTSSGSTEASSPKSSAADLSPFQLSVGSTCRRNSRSHSESRTLSVGV